MIIILILVLAGLLVSLSGTERGSTNMYHFIPLSERARSSKCPNCGEEFEASRIPRFCLSCGHPMARYIGDILRASPSPASQGERKRTGPVTGVSYTQPKGDGMMGGRGYPQKTMGIQQQRTLSGGVMPQRRSIGSVQGSASLVKGGDEMKCLPPGRKDDRE